MSFIIDHILIRYGEITLKKRNRKHFVRQLEKNIRRVLLDFPNTVLETRFERMVLVLKGDNAEEIINKLKSVFGIHSLVPVIKAEKNIVSIEEKVHLLVANQPSHINKFKVETKRSDKTFIFDSYACTRHVGSYLLRNFSHLKVDVHNPDIVVNVLIAREAVYISGNCISAVGGLPVGTGGKAMLLLSGGIDSPVAGYMAMRRGMEIECIHFASPPFTSEEAKQKVLDLVTVLSESCGQIILHIVPFTKIQTLIHKNIPDRFNITVIRRYMLQIAERICELRGGNAIVTGENLGQVASQTTESLETINEVTNKLIIRPLITMDKEEITTLAKKIGTFAISIRPFEDCCTIFKPYNPATRPRIGKVKIFEKRLETEQLISEALSNIETISLAKDQFKTDYLSDFLSCSEK